MDTTCRRYQTECSTAVPMDGHTYHVTDHCSPFQYGAWEIVAHQRHCDVTGRPSGPSLFEMEQIAGTSQWIAGQVAVYYGVCIP